MISAQQMPSVPWESRWKEGTAQAMLLEPRFTEKSYQRGGPCSLM